MTESESVDPAPTGNWIKHFQIATTAATAIAVVVGITLQGFSRWIWDSSAPDGGVWLSEIEPRVAEQGWGELRNRRSVSGAALRIGSEYYLQGVGAHAPATLVYEIPTGVYAFAVVAGIDHGSSGRGSAIVKLELDGVLCYESRLIDAGSGAEPIRIRVGGAKTLTIRIDPTEDGNRFDHVDLALAKFTAK